MRVDRESAAKLGVACGVERAAFASLAKSELFELNDRNNRKTIVELGNIDILGPESSHAIGGRRRISCAEMDQAFRAQNMLVGMPFANAEQIGRPRLAIARALGGGHDKRTRGIRYQTAV